jgi:hypothetical protein
MNMIDKIAEIVKIQASYMEGRDTAVAILEALPDMIAPLVWLRNGNHWAGGYGYVVRKLGSQYTLTIRNEHSRQLETIEDAQAFADTHWRGAFKAILTRETKDG